MTEDNTLIDTDHIIDIIEEALDMELVTDQDSSLVLTQGSEDTVLPDMLTTLDINKAQAIVHQNVGDVGVNGAGQRDSLL